MFSYESDSKAHYSIKVYISKFREYTSIASSLFFASATYVNGDRSNCIHFNIKYFFILKPVEFKIPVSEIFVPSQDNNLKLITACPCSSMHMLHYSVHVYLNGKTSKSKQ